MKKPVAMIAEGDAALRRKLSRLLCAEGIDVIDASEQKDTLRTPPHLLPDLVIVGSCRGGAWASLDEAQHFRGWTSAVPIILITPESSEQLAIAALRAGLSDYFTHPIPFDELAASVRRWLPAAGGAPPRHEFGRPRRRRAAAHDRPRPPDAGDQRVHRAPRDHGEHRADHGRDGDGQGAHR